MKSILKANGTFGYNCGLGKCDFIQAEDSLTSTARLLSVVQQTIIPFLIPGLITIFSYTYLWYHVRKSQEFMKKNGSRLYSGITFVTPIISIISCSLRRSIKSRITQRERNTTVTLFLVCFCYFLFVGPMVLLQILSTIFNNFLNQTVYLSIYCIYWFQYSFNFMIYVIRGEQYRKAYRFLFNQVGSLNLISII